MDKRLSPLVHLSNVRIFNYTRELIKDTVTVHSYGYFNNLLIFSKYQYKRTWFYHFCAGKKNYRITKNN